MRAILRICRNQSQPRLQLVEKLVTTPVKVMNYCFIIEDEVMYRLACPTPHLDVKRSSLAQEIALSASKSKFGSKALSPPRGTSDKLAYTGRKVSADRRKK